ncbi:capsular polysaccharide biosynthesis protein [Rhizobium mesoamericanum]|uniref:Wzz/FepE/Etk N-terminal domain-containing protein n=1 Tax=Rhizobium mesoamericanum TaxID=1079800 RepID=UPI0027835612|nr:Wzz/FepE/Etk N-terminal domain-containing protein [Rhizobium mesoamericanum]MDQ0562535.1 capsular polysaccharide biosynthesis protein [Rhizobium mesoamericanum]
MFNQSPTIERTSRLWRFDDPDKGASDGPIALLREMRVLIWKHKFALIACTVIGLVLGGFYARSLPRTYASTATLLLEPRKAAVPGKDVDAPQSLDLNRADSELQIVRSERLLSAVFESLDLQSDPELGPQPPSAMEGLLAWARSTLGGYGMGLELPGGTAAHSSSVSGKVRNPAADTRLEAFSTFAKRLSVRRVGQSYVIEIEYSSIDPTLPARVANAAVSGYIMQAVSFKAEAVRARSEALQGRLDALAAQVNAAGEAMKNGSLPAIPTPDADARVIGAALPPLSPAGPRGLLITLLGGILGFLFGSTWVALSLARDGKITNADELVRETNVPCWGLIPAAGDHDAIAGHVLDEKHSYAASIRDLRTSIEIACLALRSDRGMIIAVVGWTADRGISTLCRNLSQIIRGSGRYVTLFRAAETTDQRGEEAHLVAPSLVDAAVLGTSPDQLVFENRHGVAVLPIHSANETANLFVDFRHPRVSRILDAVRLKGDVLLDLPALDKSKDALALATHADVVVLVATLGKTSIGEINSGLQQLRRARAKLIGMAIIGGR